jgi:MFS family permease
MLDRARFRVGCSDLIITTFLWSDSMTTEQSRPGVSWLWLLVLFTVAGFIEAAFYGQVSAFTPLYLPRLGIPQADVLTWTGAIVAITSAIGIPFLPFWGALADRYARQPIIIRSYVAHLLGGIIMLVAGNVWAFALGRAAMSFSLGNSGLMMTTLLNRLHAIGSAWLFRS